MSRERIGPRKPATRFPHLRKQMQKNALPQPFPGKKTGPPVKKPRGGK